jgi:hypothetical protein
VGQTSFLQRPLHVLDEAAWGQLAAAVADMSCLSPMEVGIWVLPDIARVAEGQRDEPLQHTHTHTHT